MRQRIHTSNMQKLAVAAGMATLLFCTGQAMSADAVDPVSHFRSIGNACPQIDEIDAHIRKSDPDLINSDVIETTINAFSKVYYSQECTPAGTNAKYTGEPIYRAIVEDYKMRHPGGQKTIAQERPKEPIFPYIPPAAGAPASAFQPAVQQAVLEPGDKGLIGNWVGKEVCGEGTPRRLTLSVAEGANGMTISGEATYGFGMKPFDEARISGKQVQMISKGPTGDAIYEGTLISDGRLEGSFKRPQRVFKAECTWYLTRK